MHVLGTFHVGGIERLVHDMCVARQRQGGSASVVAFQEDGLFRRQFEIAGIRTAFLDKDAGVTPGLVFRLRSLLRRWRAELVHAHHFGPLLYGSAAALSLGLPVVYTEHSREVYDAPRRRQVAAALSRAIRVVTVSNELDAWWRAELGRPTTVIPNGVDVPPPPSAAERRAARRSLGIPASAFAVGCAARLSPEKDLGVLIDAVASLPGVHLAIAGAGPSATELAARIAAHGATERIRLLGLRHDVGPLTAAYDIVALSSLREGLPMAILEAMARGRPFVATAVGELPKLAAAGCGLVVPPADPAALAAAIEAFAGDPVARAAAGEAARTLARAEYSAEAMLQRYEALYEEATRPPRGG